MLKRIKYKLSALCYDKIRAPEFFIIKTQFKIKFKYFIVSIIYIKFNQNLMFYYILHN